MNKIDDAVDFISDKLKVAGFNNQEAQLVLERVAIRFDLMPMFGKRTNATELRNLKNLSNPTNCPGTL